MPESRVTTTTRRERQVLVAISNVSIRQRRHRFDLAYQSWHRISWIHHVSSWQENSCDLVLRKGFTSTHACARMRKHTRTFKFIHNEGAARLSSHYRARAIITSRPHKSLHHHQSTTKTKGNMTLWKSFVQFVTSPAVDRYFTSNRISIFGRQGWQTVEKSSCNLLVFIAQMTGNWVI